MADTDLFNIDRALTPAERKKLKRRSPVPRGHAWTPGTGPEGETCGTCRHIYRRELSKTYLKCGLNSAKWTGGHGTDIRAREAACKFWSAPPHDNQKEK